MLKGKESTVWLGLCVKHLPWELNAESGTQQLPVYLLSGLFLQSILARNPQSRVKQMRVAEKPHGETGLQELDFRFTCIKKQRVMAGSLNGDSAASKG